MSADQGPLPLRELAVFICEEMGRPVPRARGGGPVYTSEYSKTYGLLLEARKKAEESDTQEWNAVRLKEGKIYTIPQARLILEILAQNLEEQAAVEGSHTDNRRRIQIATPETVRAVIANRLSPARR